MLFEKLIRNMIRMYDPRMFFAEQTAEQSAAAAIASAGVASDATNLEEVSTPSGGKQDAPATGNVDERTPADAGGEGQTPGEHGKSGESSESDTALSVEDLLGKASPEVSIEEQLENEKRQRSASSREAQRLNGLLKDLSASLEEQGLKLVEKDGKFQGIAPTKAYNEGKAESFSLSYEGMSEDEQQLAIDNPQEFIDLIASKARSAFVRANPTMTEEPATLSSDQLASAQEAAFNRTYPEGAEKPAYADTVKKAVDSQIQNGSLPDGVKQALAKNPEFMLDLLYSKMDRVASSLITANARKSQQAIQKQEQARRISEVQPGGEMSSPATAGVGDVARRIATASGHL